jgi:hypothetical protein
MYCIHTYIQALIEGNKEQFVGPQFYSAFLFTLSMEGDLAASLTQVAEKVRPRTYDAMQVCVWYEKAVW